MAGFYDHELVHGVAASDFPTVSHFTERALECGEEALFVEIDFSAAFDMGIIRQFSSISILWAMNVLCCLFWNSFSLWSQYLLVDGYRSDPVITWCIREVFWSCCCSSCTPRSFYTIQIKLYGWPANFTLVARVPSPLDRVAVAESPNRYRNRVGQWCMWALGNKIPKESFRNLKMSWRVMISLSWRISSVSPKPSRFGVLCSGLVLSCRYTP